MASEKVSRRHGESVVLVNRAKKFASDGHDLFRSANGVWQAKTVTPKYFTVQYPEKIPYEVS